MGLDLGRVQGAGWFHTSAASSTNISVSSLQPQLTPFVGDAVAFPNGDVRQIIGVNGSIVTLGDVLFSFKGDPGIGNANLLNTYGNSNQDGYTQEAANGVVQAKNYYNQAVYDSSVSNGDQTANVTRKTEFFRLDGSEAWTARMTSKKNLPIVYVPQLPLIGTGGTFYFLATAKTNLLPVRTENDVYSGAKGISFQQNSNGTTLIHIRLENSLGYDTGEEAVTAVRNYLSQHPLYIQYEVATSYIEPVIENQPIRPANQEEEYYWHEEWRKGLNLANIIRGKGLSEGANNGAIVNDNGAYATSYIEVAPNAIYSQSGFSSQYVACYDSNKQFIGNINPNKTRTFTIPANGKFIVMNSLDTADYQTPIISKGTHPYPYEPYYGAIIRKKDLSGIQLFSEDVNPAETIGGDWEDKGTVTTSDNTIFHAYRRLS